MKKVLLAMVIASGILSATDFSSMTTEELVSLKGTVAIEDRDAFRTELQDRLSTMSVEDKEALGITPNGFGDMTGTAPADGTGLGNAGAATGGGFGAGAADGTGGGLGAGSAGGFGGGGHGQGGRR